MHFNLSYSCLKWRKTNLHHGEEKQISLVLWHILQINNEVIFLLKVLKFSSHWVSNRNYVIYSYLKLFGIKHTVNNFIVLVSFNCPMCNILHIKHICSLCPKAKPQVLQTGKAIREDKARAGKRSLSLWTVYFGQLRG